MKIKYVTHDKIDVMFAGEDVYKLNGNVCVYVGTDEGVYQYRFMSGFPTNMRSGSHAIDVVIPKFTGNQTYNVALLCHDGAYTKSDEGNHILNRDTADELLYQMAIFSGELGKFRAGIMYRALRIFGNPAYNENNVGLYAGASDLISFQWSAK